jgi:hypothetical protein
MKGALATRSPSGANRAQEKSNRSLMFVLIDVCCNERPMASATLMKRFANRVRRIGSGPFFVLSPAFAGVPGAIFERYRAESVVLRKMIRPRVGLYICWSIAIPLSFRSSSECGVEFEHPCSVWRGKGSVFLEDNNSASFKDDPRIRGRISC